MAELKTAILSSSAYEEDFVKNLYDTIISARKEAESRADQTRIAEIERAEQMRLADIERAEKMKLAELEHELKKRELEMNFELEKARLGSENSESTSSVSSQSSAARVDLKKLIPEFNPEKSDISLYLVLFERQAKRAKIEEENWVSHLLSLLPLDVIQLLARQPEDKAESYEHVKKILLQKFKLSAEVFRQKFVQHQKKVGSSWQDFAFEIKNYLDEWVEGLEIKTFQELKDLMVTDQMKKKASQALKDHFLDSWATLKSSTKAAELFDNFEEIRRVTRIIPVTCERPAVSAKEVKTRGPPTRRNSPSREVAGVSHFEKRKQPVCFKCGKVGHIRVSCPDLKRDRPERVNNVESTDQTDFLKPYLDKGYVNGIEVEILRDTGATIDLIARRFVSPRDYNGEKIWVKNALSSDLSCLPLAVVELKGTFGTLKTKAAVCGDHLDQNRYLLGNKTAEKIKDQLGYEFFPVESVNAVQTRSQTNRIKGEKKRVETREKKMETKTKGFVENDEDAIVSSTQVEDPIEIPTPQEVVPELELLKLGREEFIVAQKNSPDLKSLFDQAQKPRSPAEFCTFTIHNELLVKNQEDKLGNVRRLLVVPEGLREKIKVLCHEGTSSHLGSTKSKDKLTRCFFWPNCYKEMEDFVRTCDQCQRAGRPNERKKAPLKLVPVIREVFTKLNIDTCGPLPVTSDGNRYLITAICMSSKYPEAIPVVDISSLTVTDTLMNIFSRMGFPREVQCDQGTSFTSVLTSEFFERFGIQVRHSSVHHPQSNPVERFHRTLKRLLRALCLEMGSEWDKHLPSILLALRTVTHESTGYTPAELVFGKNLRTPETLVMEHWTEPEEGNELVTEHMFKLINRLKRCQEVAIARMEEARVKQKTWYDRNAVRREFKEGDLVLVLATTKPNKLSVQWIGPGTIRNKLSETNYVVEIPGKRERSQIYHINMLKQYHKRPEHVNVLICEQNYDSLADKDVEIPWLEQNSTVYDFLDVVQTSELDRNLNEDQRNQLRELLNRYSKGFSNEPGLTTLVEHDIELISNKPIRSKPYRMSHRQCDILKTEIQNMLRLGIVEVGESDYSSPMIIVEAPGKDPRPCVDYRRLNEIIRTEYFPLPNIEERVEKVSAAKFITILDLAKGYWQIGLSKRAQRYAAFCTPFGSYRPLRMSFGLRNAPYFFSKLMAELLQGFEDFAVPYLDDIAIFSDDWESHLKHVGWVLDRITKANLTIKPSKCRFAQTHVKYLGHIVGRGYRSPSEAKIKDVKDFPVPKTKTEIRAFLGLAGYYSRYIDGFSVLAAPLTDALKGKEKKGAIVWTESCESAFQQLKRKLTEKPVLYAPDFEREFIVQTDSSNVGMGIVLTQITAAGEEHPILYISKKFSEVEKRYSTTEKECASIVFGIKKLHYYLDGRKFTVMTDHNPLVWLKSNAGSNPRLMRWALALQPYDFRVVHRPGKLHGNADSLSRSPVED